MRRTSQLLLFSILFVLAAVSLAAQSSGTTVRARVTYVFSGSELAVDTGREELRIVLWGIQTAPLDNVYGQHARRYILTLFEGEELEVELISRIDHTRFAARATPSQAPPLAHQLVAAGLAWHDKRAAPQADIIALFERAARGQGIGVWETPELVSAWREAEATQ